MSELRQKLIIHYLSNNEFNFSQTTIDKWVIDYNISEKDIRKLIITMKRELGRFIT